MAEDAPPPEPDRVPGYPHPRETRYMFGQDTAQRSFLDAWSGRRLHHAWLLRGPQGIGKATLSYRIARALIAQEIPQTGGFFGDAEPVIPKTLDIPEGCAIQARIEAQGEPRLSVLRRTPNPNTGRMRTEISVEDVRSTRRFLQLSAADGGWRVIIVDDADQMNRNAANALLKYLEEPPPSCLFLLISHAPAGLLPTIRSRCRTLDLSPLGPDDLAFALGALDAVPPSGAETALAQLSAGSVGQALRLMAGDGLVLYALLVGMMGGGRGVDRAQMTALAESCAGRDSADRYAAALGLLKILLARLARAAAVGQAPPEAARGEQALITTVAGHPAQAAPWAETLSRISATTRHAVAVNLDPASTILDTLLQIDSTLARVRSIAA
ncbi:MAG: DNA polymerase III subunit delta' [Pseudomonadota bacterium]